MDTKASQEIEDLAKELVEEHSRENAPQGGGMKIQNGQVVEYEGRPTNRHQRRAFAKQLRKMGLSVK